MKQLFTLRVARAFMGLLVLLLAEPTFAGHLGPPPVGSSAAARLSQVVPSVKMIHSRPVAASGRQPQGPSATPASPAPERQLTTPPPAVPGLPQQVMLRGIVVRTTGQPCAGASIYPARAPRQLVVTDARGAFALPVPAGTAVSLRVEYFGEGSSRVEVPFPTAELLHITLGQ